MKRSFVFVPAILIVLLLLNSFFVLKGKDAKKKPIKEVKSSKIANIVLNLLMVDKHGRTLAKGCLKNCRGKVYRVMVSLQMNLGSIYVPEMKSITVNQIPQLLYGKKRSSLVNRGTLSLSRMGYLPIISGANF